MYGHRNVKKKSHGCTEAFQPRRQYYKRSITKRHTHTHTLVSRPNHPEAEFRQFIKQDDRSDVLESAVITDERNEPWLLRDAELN